MVTDFDILRLLHIIYINSKHQLFNIIARARILNIRASQEQQISMDAQLDLRLNYGPQV